MSRHYSSTAPFNWLRKKFKIEKPYALAWGKWDDWDTELKKNHPIAFFFTETLPDWLEKPAEWIVDPFNNLRYRIRLQYGYRTHLISTGLKPGKYYELETRMLHGMFNSLVDFVEVEKANHMVAWGDKDKMEKYNIPWWRSIPIFYWSTWRSAAAGTDHLKWEANLDDPTMDINERSPSQAIHARETIILYTWWTQIRLPRTEDSAYDICKYSEFAARMNAIYGEEWMFGSLRGGGPKLSAADRDEHKQINAKIAELEQEWATEDDDMLIRLVKLRRGLWT
jgi:hypothetical protein